MKLDTHFMPKYKALTSEYFRLIRYDAVLIGTYTSNDMVSYPMFCSAAMIYKPAISNKKLNAVYSKNVSDMKKFYVKR